MTVPAVQAAPIPAEGQALTHEVAAYLPKDRDAIADLGWTPEQMAAGYSTALRITPTRVRGLLTASRRRLRVMRG